MTSPRTPSPSRPVAPLRLAVVLLATLALAGCKGDTTPIKDILDDPARFGTEKVRIGGEVTESVGVFGTGVYEVDDGTGKIPVVSKAGGVPRQGAKVLVEGTVRPAFTIGSQTLTVLMEERRLAP